MIWKSGSPMQWQNFIKSVRRPLFINDFDFTDLSEGDDVTVLNEDGVPFAVSGPIPPPPPPMEGLDGPPPPPFGVGFGGPPRPPRPPGAPPPSSPPSGARAPSQALFEVPPFGATRPRKTTPSFVQQKQHSSSQLPWAANKNEPGAQPTIQKSKKTVKLIWKEIKEDRMLLARIKKQHTIWDELCSEEIDTAKLEELFENKAKDLMKQLPNPRTIRAAILKMDSTVMNREGIERILTATIPSAEEMNKMVEAQMANPEVPLGNAENLLLTLSSITELEPRLKYI
ncbi:FH1/FH2 domain-containing protein 3-like, partial [Varroa jacobsoni]|uniref:FH1/FH2 domain-containing protein 3-like n=1 Tax=Varroa jacobsoni TaxID=62625 RepID=UPI000BF8CD68